MMTMDDAKGITWVGNIYQKFEAMCLEVEEDTLKYMENRVQSLQTVGSSVKKFYSDVMQELLPPFSSDSDETDPNSPVENYSDVEVCKALQVIDSVTPTSCPKGKLENSEPEKKKKNLEVVPPAKKDSSPATICDKLCKNGDLLTLSGKCMKEVSFDCLPEENVINKNVEQKKLSGSQTILKSISMGSDACKALSLSKEMNESHEVTCDAKKLSSNRHTRPESVAESYDRIENATEQVDLTSFSSSHMVVFDKSDSEESMDSMFTSSTNFSEELIDEYHCGSQDQETCLESCSDLPDARGFDALETECIAERNSGMMLDVEKLKLEESCVLVSKDEFPFISQEGSNSRPYQKKIRQVFSSKNKSTRKQEYEELAILHGNSVKSNQVYAESMHPTSTEVDPKASLHSEICESEWELL